MEEHSPTAVVCTLQWLDCVGKELELKESESIEGLSVYELSVSFQLMKHHHWLNVYPWI